MHGRDHVGTVSGALLHDVERRHANHLGAVHVGVQHLRAECDQPVGEQLSRSLVARLFDHLCGVAHALKAGHGAAVRKRDYVRLMARRIKAQHRAHHALLRATIRTRCQQLHHTQSGAVWERPYWRTPTTSFAELRLSHVSHSCGWHRHHQHIYICSADLVLVALVAAQEIKRLLPLSNRHL